MNILNKAVSGAYNKVSKRNDLLNGPDPRFVSYRENGKDKKIENLDLNSDHCHSFIGKMKEDGTGTYSEEAIIALLKYFIDHTKKGEKIVIELANAVSEIMNGEDSMDEYMDFDTQREHMLELAKKISKKKLKDIEIVNIEENNENLFRVLRGQWIAGLEAVELPDLQKKFKGGDLNSLDIAQHLYRVTKEDSGYLQELKKPKSWELKEIDGDSDYYSLIEMAIRINALLHGIDLQGGIARQKKYDDLLLMHINPHITKFPALQPFQKFCWELLEGKSFKGLYFDTKESEQYLSKINKKNKLLSNVKSALYITLAVLTSAGVTYKVMTHRSEKKYWELYAKQKLELFENLRVIESWDMGSWEIQGERKAEALERYEENIFKRFMFRYGNIGKFSEQQFRNKIINILNDQKVLDMMGRFGGYVKEPSHADKFIDNYLIPKYKVELEMNGVPILPFQNLVPYSDNFIETLNASDTVLFQFANGKIKNLVINWKQSNEKISIKKIWSFSEKNQQFYTDNSVDLYLVNYHDNGEKKQIVCSSRYYSNPYEPQKISSTTAQEILPDFFEQAYPVIPALFDQYLLRYYRLYDILYRSDGPVKEKFPGNVKHMLIMDFLNKGLYKILSSKQWAELCEYLDMFVMEHEEEIKEQYDNLNSLYRSTDINNNLIPNWYLEPYEEAMKNTMNAPSSLKRLPMSSFGESNVSVKYLGEYETAEGKRYGVGVVEIDGKQYLYGYDLYYNSFLMESTYGRFEGEKIAKDYFEVKEKFLEKKTKREQQ